MTKKTEKQKGFLNFAIDANLRSEFKKYCKINKINYYPTLIGIVEQALKKIIKI